MCAPARQEGRGVPYSCFESGGEGRGVQTKISVIEYFCVVLNHDVECARAYAYAYACACIRSY